MPRGRGGYRRPQNPAPVSGPGALSQRTDGGAADRQPQRLVPAAQHGDRQAQQAQQAGAPMAAGAGPGGGPQTALPAPPDLFAPSQAGGPITAGAELGPGPGLPPQVFADDPDEILRLAYEMTGHPDLLELLQGEL